MPIFCLFEVYCVHTGRHECGVCDAADPHKAHPIGAAIDGEETWWQSPALQNGPEFHYVTVTVDLKEVGRKGRWRLFTGITEFNNDNEHNFSTN